MYILRRYTICKGTLENFATDKWALVLIVVFIFFIFYACLECVYFYKKEFIVLVILQSAF